jgi:chromosome segregation ATPase
MASSARVSKRPKTEQAAVTEEQAANAEILRDIIYEHEKERQDWSSRLLEQKTQISELQTELTEAKEELKAAKEEAKEEEAQADTATKERKKHFRKWISDLQERCEYQDNKIKELRKAANARDELLEDAQKLSNKWREEFQIVQEDLCELAETSKHDGSLLAASIHALYVKTRNLKQQSTRKL